MVIFSTTTVATRRSPSSNSRAFQPKSSDANSVAFASIQSHLRDRLTRTYVRFELDRLIVRMIRGPVVRVRGRGDDASRRILGSASSRPRRPASASELEAMPERVLNAVRVHKFPVSRFAEEMLR